MSNVRNVVSNVDVSSSENKNKYKIIDDVPLKLWHYHLVHILRGGIECLVKESIIPPLEFLDFEKCIDCNIKKIKKNEKQSARILEIIHRDICGPFPVTSVDGYASFITFTNDYLHYGYIYIIKE
jgi:hypothetical protein